jgi:hypothetical protein
MRACTTFFLMTAAVFCMATMASAADPARTGSYTTTFTETSPLTAWAVFVDHAGSAFGASKNGPESEVYRIAEEPFDIYVPSSYDGSQAYGLIAYVSPTKGGGPAGYTQVCDEHKLIWIGAANVPNERNPCSRSRLTVDGVYNISKLYRIDRDRVYVAGFSGGGRVASHIAIPYAEVFSGGAIYICGCDALSMPADPTLARQSAALSQEQRFAFMTGSEDMNKPGTKDVIHQYESMKIPYEKYFEEPGLGHSTPSVKWFTDAIIFLDSPLVTKATAQLAAAKADLGRKHWREAWTILERLASSTVAEAVATQAKPLLVDATTKFDEEAAKDLEKIMVKPQSGTLRQFVTKFPAELPSTVKARAEAERLGAEELDKLIAGKPTVAALRTFMKTWGGYAICAQALNALDGLAQEAWAIVDAMKPGSVRIKTITKFISEWSTTATAAIAGDALVKDVQDELTKIDALPSPAAKNGKLRILRHEVAGTRAEAAVDAALSALNPDQGAKKP